MRMSHATWTMYLDRLRAAGLDPEVHDRGTDGVDAEVRRSFAGEGRAPEAARLAWQLAAMLGDAAGGAQLIVSPALGSVHVTLTLYGAPPAGESEAQRALRLARQRLAEAGMADAVRVVEGVVA